MNDPLGLPAKDILKLDQFYFFTVFRNPHTRLLSAFLEKMGNRKNPRYKKFPGYGDPSPSGFGAFVSYLEAEGLHANRHWWPQVDLLFWPHQRYDHIGQLEKLEDEFRYILDQRGISAPSSLDTTKPHPYEQKQPKKITKASDKINQFYTDDLIERVYSLYKRDFEIGGYKKLPD